MSSEHEPVILDLAPPPREQVGPFLLLGLEKDADPDQVEASWAKRLIWARKKQFRLALEDVNWARETINHPDQRVRADAVSLNADTAEGTLRKLGKYYGAEEGCAPGWRPIDHEQTNDEGFSVGEIPDPAEVRAALTAPPLPTALAAAVRLLDSFVEAPLDPWTLKLTPDLHLDRTA
jgi:hypothetical protein